MTRTEFVKAMAYVTAGTGKDITPAALEVYFDCLGDLDYDVMILAAKRVLLNHKYATFPSIAELREAAVETARGRTAELCAAEAWALAWTAVARIDPEIEGSFQRATKDLPPLVVKTMRAFGVCALVGSREPVGVLRGQFLKMFEQLAAGEKAAGLLPASTRAAIESHGECHASLPRPVAAALAGIGGGGA